MYSKRYILIFFAIFVSSCIKDDTSTDCELVLEFRFDYNMEYADAFDPEVPSVDVFVYDQQGNYLFRRHEDREELEGQRRMTLRGLPSGSYHVLTVGGLSDKFIVTGLSTLEEFKLILVHMGDEVSEEFSHVWFGQAEIQHLGNKRSVWPVSLIRDTDNFNLVLHNIDHPEKPTNPIPRYSFKIRSPETGIYGPDNLPRPGTRVTYMPYYRAVGGEPGDMSVAKINTMRLFAAVPREYKLIVHDTAADTEVWERDLIPLLEETKPRFRPDGTELPLQEYLDRQSEWNIVLIYGTTSPGGNDGGYAALYLYVNDYIVWAYDIEV